VSSEKQRNTCEVSGVGSTRRQESRGGRGGGYGVGAGREGSLLHYQKISRSLTRRGGASFVFFRFSRAASVKAECVCVCVRVCYSAVVSARQASLALTFIKDTAGLIIDYFCSTNPVEGPEAAVTSAAPSSPQTHDRFE